jgi:flagellar biosynthesis protein FlhF
MNLKTFRASTMAEALVQVKSAMGRDAVILHTRTLQSRKWLGLRRREMVEITAGVGMNIGVRSAGRRPAERSPSATLPAPQVRIADPIANGRQILQTTGGSTAVMLGVSQEVHQLKTIVQELCTQVRHQHSPQVPEDLFDCYLQLVQHQVAEELAEQIVKTLQKQLRPEHLSQPQYVREKLSEQIERLMPTSGPIVRTKISGPHVVALIGPTGVGKTTTIAKLAAKLKLVEKNRVGLITIDTFRIAAVDQLRKYADIIGSPLRVVNSPDELREALASMSECEFVLIDTAGRAPRDTLKLSELRAFLDAAHPDEVHLVLSSTGSQAAVELAVEKFSDVRVDKIIFTKLDEAAHVGTVLNVVRKVNKSLSYITTGQDVPDDIEVGHGRRLAQMILGSGL